MRKYFPAFVLAVLLIPSSASAELRLTMEGGLVTIYAKDVPLSAVMAEWAKVGKTQILNGDKIFTPVTLQLEAVPERKALDILLRGAAGYMIAERATPVAGASTFDRIMILPTSRPPANAPPLQQSTPPAFNAPRPMPVPVQPDDDDQNPNPGAQNPGAQNPGQPPPGAAQQPGMPTNPNPQAPLMSPRPGMLPQPQQPAVPFGAPRPGGGGTQQPPRPGGGGGGA